MLDWKHASIEDLRRLRSIGILLGNHPELLEWFFDSDEALLRYPAEVIGIESLSLSSGERLLLSFALDFWNGTGKTRFYEALFCLDSENYNSLVSALISWKTPINQRIAIEKPTVPVGSNPDN